MRDQTFAPAETTIRCSISARMHRVSFAQKVGNGHAARSEICNRQSSGTQQRCAISSAIALADCTWLLAIGDRRMRIGDVQKPASDYLCKAFSSRNSPRPANLADRGHTCKWIEDFSSPALAERPPLS